MSKEIIVVFTAKTKEKILLEGGTSSWKLDCNRARLTQYAICTRNQNRILEGGKGDEPHQSAFLIGKIKDVVQSLTNQERFLIQFSEYALVDIPKLWKGDQNPVKYYSETDAHIADIDFHSLDWHHMPEQKFDIAPAENVKDLALRSLTVHPCQVR